MSHPKLLKSPLACVVTLGAASVATAAMAQQPTPMKMTPAMMKMDRLEPCYGISAACKNDCQSPGHSCAGQDGKARDSGAFVVVPAGLCQKIDGGSPKAS